MSRWRVNMLQPVGGMAAALLCASDCAWASDSGGGFYTGDFGQAIAAIAVFLVLLAILRKWAWGPIIKQLRQREEHISQSIQHAKELEEKAQNLFDDYSKRLDRAQDDAADVVSQAKREADQLREEVLAAARKDAQSHVRQAKHEIATARDEAMNEMRQMTAEMAVDMAEQIIRRDLDPTEQRRLLGELMEDVRSSAAKDS